MSQQELAAALGVRQASVSAWETGGDRPNNTSKRKLCEVLGVTVDELLVALNDRRPVVFLTRDEFDRDSWTPAELASKAAAVLPGIEYGKDGFSGKAQLAIGTARDNISALRQAHLFVELRILHPDGTDSLLPFSL